MKPATAVIFLLFALTTKSYFFEVANAANNPVLDIDGDEVRTGVEYYVWPIFRPGGGLALGRANDKPCPEIVVQRPLWTDIDNGTPVIFSNQNSSDNVVHVSTDINVEFLPIRDRLCLTSTVWKLDDYDPSTGKWWVTTDGTKGNPGPNTLMSWFRIENAISPYYIFKYCPSVCESCISLCSNIGRYEDDGQFRLALGDQAWQFFFAKASSQNIKQVA